MEQLFSRICFTGHTPRHLGGYSSNPIHQWVKQSLAKAIHRAIKQGAHKFISGGALGVDQWAAEIIIDIKSGKDKAVENPWMIDLVMAIPFPSHGSNWSNPETINNYHRILREADKVVNISDDPYKPMLMQLRNIWMVDRADCVIAVWKTGKPGGTANTLKYAIKKRKPILWIEPDAREKKWIRTPWEHSQLHELLKRKKRSDKNQLKLF